jgi:hypothetical protein
MPLVKSYSQNRNASDRVATRGPRRRWRVRRETFPARGTCSLVDGDLARR